jgi:hypothetical protein
MPSFTFMLIPTPAAVDGIGICLRQDSCSAGTRPSQSPFRLLTTPLACRSMRPPLSAQSAIVIRDASSSLLNR